MRAAGRAAGVLVAAASATFALEAGQTPSSSPGFSFTEIAARAAPLQCGPAQ